MTEDQKPGDTPQLIHPVKVGVLARLRTNFLTGIIVVAPIAITAYLAWQFVGFVDDQVRPLIPARYNPESYIPFALPGIGLLVSIVAFTMIGALTASFFGRALVRFGERLVDRMPVIRAIYSALKQIFETVLAQSSTSFRECVLVEYPRRNIWTIAFVTSETAPVVQNELNEEMVNIYVPTTPNPTSGFLLFVPKKDLIYLDLSVEDGLKHIISTGIVAPPDNGNGDDVENGT